MSSVIVWDVETYPISKASPLPMVLVARAMNDTGWRHRMALTVKEAKEIMRRLGPAELEFAVSICTPLYWVVRGHDGKPSTRNGTAFFLQTREALFGVRLISTARASHATVLQFHWIEPGNGRSCVGGEGIIAALDARQLLKHALGCC
jgi:hypothetical protein